MSEPYEVQEVLDYKKIGLVVGIIAVAGIIGYFFLTGYSLELPNIPGTNFEIPEMVPNQLDQVKPQYEKFIDFGLSEDDILDFQNLPCDVLHNQPELISQEPKFEAIKTQREIECQ